MTLAALASVDGDYVVGAISRRAEILLDGS